MKTMRNSSLTLLFLLGVLISACTPGAEGLPQSNTVASPTDATASDIALTAADLGPGWVLDAEVNDLDASYYFDQSPEGKGLIGTHRTVQTPAFDPAIVESITMRAYSNPGRKLVFFHHVIVFHEADRAGDAILRTLPEEVQAELPREWTTSFGERYSARALDFGEKGVLVTGWFDEDHPLMKTLAFQKGRVAVGVNSMSHWDGNQNIPNPPEEDARLEELARLVESRIPVE